MNELARHITLDINLMYSYFFCMTKETFNSSFSLPRAFQFISQ